MAGTRISRRSVLGTVGAASLAPSVLPLPAQVALTPGLDPAVPAARPAFAARLHVGAASSDQPAGACTWVPVMGGDVDGPLLRGAVQGGQLKWRRHSARQLLELDVRINVLRSDGALVEICERSLHPEQDLTCCTSPLCLRPELLVAGDAAGAREVLIGRLDARALGAGRVTLLAFAVS